MAFPAATGFTNVPTVPAEQNRVGIASDTVSKFCPADLSGTGH